MILFSVLFLLGCGDIGRFEEISKRIDGERDKLSDLFPQERFVTVAMYCDFGSLLCKQSFEDFKSIKSDFGIRVDTIYKHFPVDKNFEIVSEASECAKNQNKFQEFIDGYFSKYAGFHDEELLQELALELGLDIDEFDLCLNSHSTHDRIAQNIKEAKKYRVNEVPFFVINEDIQVPGAIPGDTLHNLVDKLLHPEKKTTSKNESN